MEPMSENAEEVHVFGRHLMPNTKTPNVDENEIQYNSREDNYPKAIEFYDQDTEQEQRKECDGGKQNNPWISKKPLHNDGPFTVKYPEMPVSDGKEPFLEDWHSDLLGYPIERFEFPEVTQPDSDEWCRRRVKENESEEQWWHSKRNQKVPCTQGLAGKAQAGMKLSMTMMWDF